MIDEVNPSGAIEETPAQDNLTPPASPEPVASEAPTTEAALGTEPVQLVDDGATSMAEPAAAEPAAPEMPTPVVLDMPTGSDEPALPEAVSAVEITESGFAIAESDTTATVIAEADGRAAADVSAEADNGSVEVDTGTSVGANASTSEVEGEGDEADNFIKEKASQVRAAKKKATTPRVRAPRKTKEKLPDLGDGSGYEPPEPTLASLESPEVSEPQDDAMWYAVHCYSGYENKVKHSLEQRIETMGMAGRILEVVVPTEEEIEVRDGKRKTVERRVFPGYVIVRMKMSEDSWHVVRNTPGVTRFIGMGNRPQPLTPQEVNQILKRMEAEAPKIKVNFKTGQKVRITDGPFADLMGLVDRIDTEHAKVVVLVNFFGRDTPVELDFLQVEKM